MQTIINPNFTNKVLTGATATQPGVKGVVPAPAAGDQDRILTGAGIWRSPQQRNLIINGNFQIAQRGISFAIAGASINSGTFLMDRWYWAAVADGGTTAPVNITREIFPSGQTDVPGNPDAFLRVSNSNQGTALGNGSYHILVQKIENLKLFSGQTVTVSFYARSSISGKQIASEIMSDFGSGGSPVVFVTGTVFTLTSVWQRYVATFQMPSHTGKTYGNNHTALLHFWLQAGNTFSSRTGISNINWQGAGTVDIANVQVELDRQASPFEQIAFAQAVSDCQYYYQTLGAKGSNYSLGRYSNFSNATNLVFPAFTFRAMRANPTVVAEADISDGVAFSMTPAELTNSSVAFQQSVPSNGWLDVHWVELNAEL